MSFSFGAVQSAFDGALHALQTQVSVNQSAVALCAIGAVNWGVVALKQNDLNEDLVHQVARQLYPSSTATQDSMCTAVYSAIGIAGVVVLGAVTQQNLPSQ